jgi:hypothetical protein
MGLTAVVTDAYSSSAPDPTSGMSRGQFLSNSVSSMTVYFITLIIEVIRSAKIYYQYTYMLIVRGDQRDSSLNETSESEVPHHSRCGAIKIPLML